MTLPNFLIIGAAKAGTTSLYNYLEQHPDVFMSPDKEPRFFAFEGDTSGQYTYTELSKYETLFKDVKSEKAIGEASTYYLFSDTAPASIKKHIPDVKLIAILRNPIDRAYSQYVYWKREGKEKENTFEDVVKKEKDLIASGSKGEYLSRGMYSNQLENYFKLFEKDQIKTFKFETLCKKPKDMAREVFEFLNIDDSFEVDFSKTFNVSTAPQSGVKQFIYSFVVGQNRINTLLNKMLPDFVYWKIVVPFARKFAGMLRSKKKDTIEPLDSVTRKDLIEFYKEDILRTQEMLGYDLSSWLELSDS